MIGFERIVGDGAVVGYIQDIMINQLYQNQKLGTLVIDKLMKYIDNNCIKNSFIGLIALDYLNKFYNRFSFI